MEQDREKLNIIILTDSPFPIGLASTSRIIAYAGGFIDNGARVKVVCYRPTEKKNNVINKEISGIYNHIPFIYSCNNNIIRNNIISRNIANFISIFRVVSTISKYNKNDKVHAILLYSKYFMISLIFRLFTSRHNIIFLKEENEYPEVVFKNTTIFHRFYIYLYSKFIYKLFDGFLIITDTLLDYINPRKQKKALALKVPIIVNRDRFDSITNHLNNENITFCGYIGWNNEGVNKEGVPILIDAFKIVKKKYSGIKLQIIGYSPYPEDFDKINNQIKNLGLENDVIILKGINSTEILGYLVESKILVLARPSSRQSSGGFPTKLGEYLMTGKPVVVTNVGEIEYYLKDGVNAYISEPNSSVKFAEKLLEVLDNYDSALKIGQKGKETAIKEFDNVRCAKNILDFILELKTL